MLFMLLALMDRENRHPILSLQTFSLALRAQRKTLLTNPVDSALQEQGFRLKHRLWNTGFVKEPEKKKD